jgi:hypothetical protein
LNNPKKPHKAAAAADRLIMKHLPTICQTDFQDTLMSTRKAPSNDDALNYCILKSLYIPFETKVMKEIIFPITYPTNLKMQSIMISNTSHPTKRPNIPRIVSNLLHQLTSVLLKTRPNYYIINLVFAM